MTGQRERVLRALRNAGPVGITQVSFLGPITVDGGPPITRLAARIVELREEGHVIGHAGRRDKCAVYVLRGAVGRPVPAVAPPASPGEVEVRLFDPSSLNTPAGAYDELDAA